MNYAVVFEVLLKAKSRKEAEALREFLHKYVCNKIGKYKLSKKELHIRFKKTKGGDVIG